MLCLLPLAAVWLCAGATDASSVAVAHDGHVGLLQCKAGRVKKTSRSAGSAGQPDAPVHVVWSSDATNFRPLFNSMTSLALHAEHLQQYVFHLITPGADVANATKMIASFKESVADSRANRELPTVKLHESIPLNFSTAVDRYSRLQGIDIRFARLQLDRYMPTEQRAIVLDTDTIVKSDLTALYMTDMGDCAIAAAPENAYFDVEYLDYVLTLPRERLPHTHFHYFNSGVLLIDLERWRGGHISEAIAELGNTVPHVSDQLMFNSFFHHAATDNDECVLDLDWKYNVYNLGGQGPIVDFSDEQVKSGYILHWSGNCKPWESLASTGCSPNDPHEKFRAYYEDFTNHSSFFARSE